MRRSIGRWRLGNLNERFVRALDRGARLDDIVARAHGFVYESVYARYFVREWIDKMRNWWFTTGLVFLPSNVPDCVDMAELEAAARWFHGPTAYLETRVRPIAEVAPRERQAQRRPLAA